MAEVRDVAEGLWIWRLEHPAWHEGYDWEPLVTSTVVESGGEVALIDPLAPPEDAAEIWERLDAQPPTMVVILKPDHVRDVDLFAHRYDLRAAYGPYLFWAGDAPRTELEGLEPERELPGGLVTLYDGRGRNETPGLASGTARPHLRRRPDRSRRRASRLGHALAREARPARFARASRPPVRARDRLARGAGARPRGLRRSARTAPVGRLIFTER
jgi:hypothetical protein